MGGQGTASHLLAVSGQKMQPLAWNQCPPFPLNLVHAFGQAVRGNPNVHPKLYQSMLKSSPWWELAPQNGKESRANE